MSWFEDTFNKIFKKKNNIPEVTRPDIDATPKPPVKKGNEMKMSGQGLALLTQWEGFKTTVYKDVAGHPTIGVGHLLTKDELSSGKININGEIIKIHNGITQQQVVDLLGQDLRRYEETVRNCTTTKLEQHQFDALVSFCFNVGQGAFKNSTLLKRVNVKNFNDVPYQFSRWNKAGGRVIKGLINRRKNEIKLWEGKF